MGMWGGYAQLRDVEGGDLDQVAHRRACRFDLEDVGSSSRASSAASMPRCTGSIPGLTSRRTIGANLRCCSSVSIMRQQVVGVLLVALGVGVAGDPEKLAADHLHPREKHVEVVGSSPLPAARSCPRSPTCMKRGAPAPTGTLTRAREISLSSRVAQGHQQVERQVGDEGEGVGRVHGLGRDQREDVPEIVLAQLPLLSGRELRVARMTIPSFVSCVELGEQALLFRSPVRG